MADEYIPNNDQTPETPPNRRPPAMTPPEAPQPPVPPQYQQPAAPVPPAPARSPAGALRSAAESESVQLLSAAAAGLHPAVLSPGCRSAERSR